MRFAAGCLFLLLMSVQVEVQDRDKPQAVPLFSNVEQGPAFMVECVNTSAATIRATELVQEIAFKLDGKLYERTGGIGGSFLGGEPFFEPAQRWRVMLGLRQGPTGTKSADFDAALRTPWLLPLQAGRHTIAFRCVGQWSDEIEFHWESAAVPG